MTLGIPSQCIDRLHKYSTLLVSRRKPGSFDVVRALPTWLFGDTDPSLW